MMCASPLFLYNIKFVEITERFEMLPIEFVGQFLHFL
jgi:hypothetical protein